MKLIFLQVGKQQKLLEFFQNSLYSFNVTIFVIISVNEDIVQIHNNKNIKLLSKNLINVFLKAY